MDVKYVNPFISALMNTFEMMVGITPDRRPPYIKSNIAHDGDVTGMIGFADKDIAGSVALSFPTATALMTYHQTSTKVH